MRRLALFLRHSKARRAGVKPPPPEQGKATEITRGARRAYETLQSGHRGMPSKARSRAITKALQHEPRKAASSEALSRQAKAQARQRTAKQRSQIAKKAAKTRLAHQSHAQRQAIARNAARTRKARAAGA